MRTLIFLVSIFFLCKHTIAQSRHFKKIMPGFEFGLNNAQQQMRQAEQVATMRSGIRVGLSLEKPATRRLTFIGTISYVQAGARNIRFTSNDERLNYLELNIKPVKYIPVGGSDIYFSLGPYFSYGINGKITNSDGETITNNAFDLPGYNHFEWGLGGNIGYKTPWGTYFHMGLQSAFNNFYEVQEIRYFNFSLMFTAGHTIAWRNFKSFKKTP